jgi:hypothetical protein
MHLSIYSCTQSYIHRIALEMDLWFDLKHSGNSATLRAA